jgi:hypothetical protein
MGAEGFFPGVKGGPGVKRTIHLAKFKNTWSYTSTSPYVFMVWYLVKHRYNFTFLFELIIITQFGTAQHLM